MLVPLASHNKWYRRAKIFILCAERSSDSLSQTLAAGGVLDLAARSGDIGVRFGDFCEKNHVSESWEFILKVMAFKKVRGFARFFSLDCRDSWYSEANLPERAVVRSHFFVALVCRCSNNGHGLRCADAASSGCFVLCAKFERHYPLYILTAACCLRGCALVVV